jgi:hypothetical protein
MTTGLHYSLRYLLLALLIVESVAAFITDQFERSTNSKKLYESKVRKNDTENGYHIVGMDLTSFTFPPCISEGGFN